VFILNILADVCKHYEKLSTLFIRTEINFFNVAIYNVDVRMEVNIVCYLTQDCSVVAERKIG